MNTVTYKTNHYTHHNTPKNQLKPNVARRLFYYDPKTGDLYRKYKNGKIRKITSTSGGGYLQANIRTNPNKQTFFRCHNIVWNMFNGKIPDGFEVDHKNRDLQDNRIENLRLVSHQENCRNK